MKYLFAFILPIIVSFGLSAKTIHKEKSIYRNIVITESRHHRCMRFESRRNTKASQACIDLKDKDHLVFEYTKSVLAGLAFNSAPKSILIIGLGGGSLPNAFSKLLPNTEITTVEIDPAVETLAKKYFDYQENKLVKTVIKDGRVFVKRALKQSKKFDWIILDAFNGDYIPEHLMTQEFLQQTKKLLSEGGILAANTFSGSRLYDYESVTYQSVFGELRMLKSPTKGNRIIYACNCQQIDSKINVTANLIRKLEPYGVDLTMLVNRLSSKVNWDTKVPPLTDQFSPANLLNQE